MWLNRPSLASTFFIILAGCSTMLITSFWSMLPDKHEAACQDVLERVDGRLYAARCGMNQEISYVQDLSNERYIICRCRVPGSDNTLVQRDGLILPVPGFIRPEEEDNKEIVPRQIESNTGTEL